jgi:hypothetical protein
MRNLLITAMLSTALAAGESAPPALDACNVVLDGPSANASGALPIGNGSLGASVWVEPGGDLVILLSHTDTFSEASRLLKVGRIRLRTTPALLAPATPCRQELQLRHGRVALQLGAARLSIFVEPGRPVVRVVGDLGTPGRVQVVDDGWRGARTVLAGISGAGEFTMNDGELGSSWTMDNAPKGITVAESADIRLDAATAATAIGWYHRNDTSVVALTLAHQGCAGLPGAFDPLLGRTFGAWIDGPGLARTANGALEGATSAIDVRITCPVLVTKDGSAWVAEARRLAAANPAPAAAQTATAAHWSSFWDRSWILVDGEGGNPLPANRHPLRIGVDSAGANRFAGTFGRIVAHGRPLLDAEVAALASVAPEAAAPELPGRILDLASPAGGSQRDGLPDAALAAGLGIAAWIKPAQLREARILDSMTAGGSDGFIFDTWPGDALRLIAGERSLHLKGVLTPDTWQHVAVSYDCATGGITMWRNGVRIGSDARPRVGVAQAYQLHRYAIACQSRGEFPAKFNGGIFTVEPRHENAKLEHSPDWRRWGDCYWWQNTRLIFHPMIMAGDFDLMEPLWKLYARPRQLAESRSTAWYGSQGSWIPETMTLFGTYANKDYGWNREGKAPGEVSSPWWRWNWVQGPELIDLLLKRWEWSGDEGFATRELLPQAESLLRYIDTRFRRDDRGLLYIDPAQSAETYWHGVANDLPTIAGLRNVLPRLLALREGLATPTQRELFARLWRQCPAVPVGERETKAGRKRVLLPAWKFEDRTNNCENTETYAIWPFPHYGIGKADLEMARTTYAVRKFNLPSGWGYDSNLAAALGLAEEAGRLLFGRAQNSHPNFRFPATWGPNFDWLPDNCHGGNLMTTAQMMLMQCEGDTIRLLPAWPQGWNVDARLHAPRGTTVRLQVADGKLVRCDIHPAERRRDVLVTAPYALP